MRFAPLRNRDWLWLLWPPSWFVIFSSAKDFSRGGLLGSASLNAAGLHVWRKALADRLCARRRARMRASLPAALTEQWDRSGYLLVNDFLPTEQWSRVCDELTLAVLPFSEMSQPPALTRRAYLDRHNCRGRYPALLQLISDKTLIGLLHYAAGYRGRPVVAVQCVHSDTHAASGQDDPQTDWHSDTFHSTAKGWLFLHPVGAADGPFSYWTGSHRATAGRLQWEHAASVVAVNHANRLHARGSFRTEDVDVKQMGYGDPMVAAVPGNTLIIADTSGFHRRTPSQGATVRVEIYFSLRRNPFLSGLFPSLLAWPILRDRWAGWLFAWYVWLHARGKPSWIPAENMGLIDSEKRALHRSVSASQEPSANATY